MPLTGVDFDKIIDLKSDSAYSGYFDNFKKNRIIREATNKAIDFKIATNDRIQTESDLFGIYKTNQTFTPTSNAVSLIPAGAGITDYYRMMNVKAKFVIPLTGNYISGALNNSPLRFTLHNDSNLRTGEQVVISGVTTNTNANGTRYVKMISPKVGLLYSDANLLTPILGNGVYTGTVGAISRVVYNWAKDLHSNRKFSQLNEPDYRTPFYEIGSGSLKILPTNWACSEITVDYICVPTYIDVNNSSTDLLITYSTRMIDFIAEFVIKAFGESSRDSEEIMIANAEIQAP